MNLFLVIWPLVAILMIQDRTFVVQRWTTAAILLVELGVGLAFGQGWPPALLQTLWTPHATVPFGPALAAAVALVAVVMMSRRDAKSRWFTQILVMTAGAAMVTGFSDLRMLLAGWILNIVPFAWEVWRTPVRRVFAIHMSMSVLGILVGVVLLSNGSSTIGFWVLAIGIGIREAALPAHAWLPNVLRYLPMPLVVVFVAPQIGIAAHLDLLAGSPPPGFVEILAIAAASTALGGAILAAFQDDARKALAYLMVSQSGLVAFGLEAKSTLGQSGAILVWVSSSIAFAGFAMILAAVEARRGRMSIKRPSGNFDRIPHLATAWLFLGLACVGLPGTVGFIAEDLLVEGTVEDFPLLAMVIVITTAINAIAVLRVFFGVFTGTSRHVGEQDMLPREKVASTAVMAILVVLGLAPGLASHLLSSNEGASNHSLAQVQHKTLTHHK